MTDEFDGLGQAEVIVNNAPVERNDIDKKDINGRKISGALPRPFGLEKRLATQRSITIRFRPPDQAKVIIIIVSVCLRFDALEQCNKNRNKYIRNFI